ncbi:MAG TPA: hypothetical protein VN650_01655 [Gemmatimonadaceae bacterium]|nr:hypothetical protein [Gemmatimonadaceae bacterium]
MRTLDALVTFFDMFMVWIVRHCFLIEFGRWPGYQILHTAFERLEQQQPRELCGCGSSLTYAECHLAVDAALTEDDHSRLIGGTVLSRREVLMRRQIPRSAAEFDAAALLPAPEVWAKRLRQEHDRRMRQRAQAKDVVAAALAVVPAQHPGEGG